MQKIRQPTVLDGVPPPDGYVIRTPARERIENALGQQDIQTRRLYPPLAPLPNATLWYETSLALPLYADLTWEDQDRIVSIIREAVS